MTKKSKTTFGENLEYYMQYQQITQAQLAKKLHTHPSTISKWLNEGRGPDCVMLVRLADYFKVNTEKLLRPHDWRSEDFVEMRIPKDLVHLVRQICDLEVKPK